MNNGTTKNLYQEYIAIESEYSNKLDAKEKDKFQSKFIFEKIDIVLQKNNFVKFQTQSEINDLDRDISILKNNIIQLSLKIMFKKNEKILLNKKKDLLNDIKTEINTKLSSTNNSKKNNEIKNINQEQEQFNNSLDAIYNFASQYEDKINKMSLNKSVNKISFLYDENKDFKKLINDIKGLIITSDIESLTLKINNYYSKNNDIFMKKINEIISQLNNDEIKPFFEQYQKLYKELIQKISNILDKISNGLLTINQNSINYITIFTSNIIKTKVKKQTNIVKNENDYSQALTNKKTKKGKFTEILIYTDNLFYYFIDLLIIIDYLTFFYQ
jgi:hypothetical protein